MSSTSCGATRCLRTDLHRWPVRQPLRVVRPERDDHRLGRRVHPDRLLPGHRQRRLPDHLRHHHRRAHQRCYRATGPGSAPGSSSRESGSPRLLPPRPHGLGRWPAVRFAGRASRPGSSASPSLARPAAAVAPIDFAGAPSCTSTPAWPPWSSRSSWAGARASADRDASAQPAFRHAGCCPSVVRLVRVQRRTALAADGTAGLAWINTTAATCAAMLRAITEKVRDGHATSLGAASGVVAGLVAITPAAGARSPVGSLALGLVAGAPAPSPSASSTGSATTTHSTSLVSTWSPVCGEPWPSACSEPTPASTAAASSLAVQAVIALVAVALSGRDHRRRDRAQGHHGLAHLRGRGDRRHRPEHSRRDRLRLGQPRCCHRAGRGTGRSGSRTGNRKEVNAWCSSPPSSSRTSSTT